MQVVNGYNFKLFQRSYSNSDSLNATTVTSEPIPKPQLKRNKRASTLINTPEENLLEELERFKKSIEKNKPLSAAWCTGLIARATELRT